MKEKKAMCPPGSSESNAAQKLSEMLEKYRAPTTFGLGPSAVREMIRKDWTKLCALAHAVHDEETSEQQLLLEAVENVALLDEQGVQNVLNGRASREVINNFKIVARKVLELK